MAQILALDPGAQHCGMAVFHDTDLVVTYEMDPHGLYDWWRVGQTLHGNSKMRWDVVVCEGFRLYPGALSKAQSWSTLATVEVIGVVRERCRQEGTPFILQPPSIKKATAGILRSRRVQLAGKGDHVRDAQLHAWHFLLKAGA